MKKVVVVMVLVFLLGVISKAYAVTPEEVIVKMDKLLRGKTNISKATMIITKPEWQRSSTMISYMKGDKRTFIRFLSPAKDRGTSFLKIDYNLWMYLPSVEKVIRIPPAMMMQDFMGSDFSNDDLVKESSIVKDYTHKITQETETTYVLDSIPKPNAPVVYGKLRTWILKNSFIPVKEEFYSDRLELVKVMYFSKIKKMGGRLLPTHWKMVSVKKKGSQTELILESAEFDVPISENIFTKENLTRINF